MLAIYATHLTQLYFVTIRNETLTRHMSVLLIKSLLIGMSVLC
jgi:hypothetical protein